MTAIAAVPPVPRDRYKRPLIVPPGAAKPVPYTRCTTFVSCVEDTSTLTAWAKRMVLLGVIEDPEILSAAAAADKQELGRLAERAMQAAKANDKRETGTHLHSLTEYVDRGQPLPAYVETDGVHREVTAQDRADMHAYYAAMGDLTVEHIETLTVLDDLRVAGTPDRIVSIGGRRFIADVKTGSVKFGALKMAMQLAVYSRSEFYDHTTATRTPLPDVDQDRAIIIHLPAGSGTCSLLWLDIAAGWEAVQVAANVRKARAVKNILSPWTAA